MSDHELNSVTGIPTLAPGDEGRKLGKYQLVRKLGRGGMGEVWLARDTVAKIDVALKFLPLELRRSEDAQEQLSDSYRRVHGLHHPHICAVKDLILDPVIGYFLVMDYFEGVTLSKYRKDYLKQHGSFPIAELVRVLTPVADALDYAHSQNLLHRDIKPGNILISADGSRVRVIDFQLATEIRATLSRYTNTQFDTSGTYPYMAPEQFRGSHATPATDQYALAMTAYETLAGQLPFETLGWDMWKSIVTDPQTTLPEIGGLDPQAHAALSRVLGVDPKQRAASCKAFVTLLTQKATAAQRPPEPSRASKATPTPVVPQAAKETSKVWTTQNPQVDARSNQADRSTKPKPAARPATPVQPPVVSPHSDGPNGKTTIGYRLGILVKTAVIIGVIAFFVKNPQAMEWITAKMKSGSNYGTTNGLDPKRVLTQSPGTATQPAPAISAPAPNPDYPIGFPNSNPQTEFVTTPAAPAPAYDEKPGSIPEGEKPYAGLEPPSPSKGEPAPYLEIPAPAAFPEEEKPSAGLDRDTPEQGIPASAPPSGPGSDRGLEDPNIEPGPRVEVTDE